MSDGVLLHMYRDCGISEDEHDLDWIVPLKYVLKVRHAFKESEHFGVHEQDGHLGRRQIGYHFSGYHIETGVDIDIFSLNEVNGSKFAPLWMNHKLYYCDLPDNLEFGYKLKVNGFEFSVIGPIEEYLVSVYGKDWRTPIKTKDWDEQNPRYKPYESK